MENEIIFDNIKHSLTALLNDAEQYIWVAVAWITDIEYLQILEMKMKEGVDVRVLVMEMTSIN